MNTSDLLKLSDDELVATCTRVPSASQICMDDKFWERRYKMKYPLYAQFYNGRMTWAKYYIETKNLLSTPLTRDISNKYVGKPELLQILGTFGYYPSRFHGYGKRHDGGMTHCAANYDMSKKNLPDGGMNWSHNDGGMNWSHGNKNWSDGGMISSVPNHVATNHVATNHLATNHVATNHAVTTQEQAKALLSGKMIFPSTATNSTNHVVPTNHQDGGRGFGGGLLLGTVAGLGLGAVVGSEMARNRDGGYGHGPENYASGAVCNKGCGASRYN